MQGAKTEQEHPETAKREVRTMIIELVADTVSHDEAEEAVGRMIASHFNKNGHEHMGASIPANPRRDDIRLLAYIAQRRNVDTELAAERAKVNYLEQSKIPALEEIIQEERSKVKELEDKLAVEHHNAQAWKDDCKKIEAKNAAMRTADQYESQLITHLTKHHGHAWLLLYNPLEIIPLDDIIGHILGETCKCGPEYIEDGILVHKAVDGREAYENGERKPQ